MKIKKILAGILVLAIAAATVGCGSAPSNDNSGNTAKQPTKTAAEMKIGVIQGSEHVALDAACAGFVETLVANGFTEDNIDVQNAQGEQSNCGTIATKFVNDGVDLILTIGTPASQAAAQATKDIPILVTAVTDPASAGLVKSNEKPECNVSGTSDMNPIKEQIDLLMKFVPEAKNVGIMYCSSEVNSEIQADLAKADLEGRGIAVKYYTAADSSEIQAVMQSAVDKVDAIYIPTDNLFAGAMDTVALVSIPNKIPVICGEAGMVKSGGLATYGIEYKALGVQTAKQAIEILINGANIAEMPIGYSPVESLEITINDDMAQKLDIEVPADLKK